MTCFSPTQGFEKAGITQTGGFAFTQSIKYARRVNGIAKTMEVPCHRCEGCRNDAARDWAIKLQHEASLYFDVGYGYRNAFVTLTYNDDSMPLFGGLDYKIDFTKWLKRFRKNITSRSYMKKFGLPPVFEKLRFFMCGEYGDLNLRPHYHVLIFGYDFPDKYIHDSHNGIPIYRSPFLESLWTVPKGCKRRPLRIGESLGYSSTGTVTFESAAYVARYGLKKIIGKDQLLDADQCYLDLETGVLVSSRYTRWNMITGDRVRVESERHLHSNNPGIARRWFELYHTDVFPKDHFHMGNGLICRPPKYYDELLRRMDPLKLENIKKSRQDFRLTHADEFTPERLAQKRVVFNDRISKLTRNSRRIYDT